MSRSAARRWARSTARSWVATVTRGRRWLGGLSAKGPLGDGLAVALDFADVGLSFIGVGGDGVHGDVGVEDEADRAGVGVAAGEGKDLGAVGFGPSLFRVREALPAWSRSAASMTSARSIWSQVLPKSGLIGSTFGPRSAQ